MEYVSTPNDIARIEVDCFNACRDVYSRLSDA